MPAPSASGFDLLCRNTTIATADRQQTNATTITALVVARMPKFIVGPQPVGTSRVFPQPAREQLFCAFSKNLPVFVYLLSALRLRRSFPLGRWNAMLAEPSTGCQRLPASTGGNQCNLCHAVRQELWISAPVLIRASQFFWTSHNRLEESHYRFG